jgi:glutathione S-transferase
MALTLYFHPLSSFCHKVLIELYESETPFTDQVVDFGDKTAKAAFLELGRQARFRCCETNAMTARFQRPRSSSSISISTIQAHPLLPEERAARLEARLWDRLFDLNVMVPMQKVVGDRLKADGERDPGGVADAISTLRMAYNMIERGIEERTRAAGEAFSIADCAAAPALFFASLTEPFPQSHTLLAAYFERLMRRPSIKRTLAEARPFFELFPLKDSIPARFLAYEPPAG